MLRYFNSSVLAGICIGIGGWVNLAVGGPLGAILFAFGLLTVVHYKFKLYTGTAGFVSGLSENVDLSLIIFGNIVGVTLVALLTKLSPQNPDASAIVASRIATGWWRCGLLSIGCGFIMTTAVTFARQGKFLPLLFGVPVFILCGFPHCIADAFYYAVSGVPFWVWISTVVGNYIGCNLYRILPFAEPQSPLNRIS